MLTKLQNWLEARHIPVRLILSVVAGIALAMTLSIITHELLYLAGIFPPLHKPMFETRLVIVELIYHSLYVMAGAYLTASLAREQATKAVFILGTKEVLMWILGTLLLWHHTPPWYNLTKAILGIPLALLAGKIYAWRRRKKTGAMAG